MKKKNSRLWPRRNWQNYDYFISVASIYEYKTLFGKILEKADFDAVRMIQISYKFVSKDKVVDHVKMVKSFSNQDEVLSKFLGNLREMRIGYSGEER